MVPGSFSGLVGDGQTGNGTDVDMAAFFQRNGILSLTARADGTFTGSLRLEGKSLPVKGKFEATGAAPTLSVKLAGGRTAKVALNYNSSAPVSITGNVTTTGNATIAGATLPFEALPGTTSGANLRYTIVLPAPVATENTPRGHGYATLAVTANGKSTLAGKLADGTSFSATSQITDGGNNIWVLPVFVPLYSSAGMICGGLHIFKNETADSAMVTGNLGWLRPPITKAKVLPGGFLTSLAALGEKYQPKKDTSLLTGTGETGNFTLMLDPAGAALAQPGAWPKSNIPALAKPVPAGMKLTFTGATGVFKGTFCRAAGAKSVSTAFEGVVLANPMALSDTKEPVRAAGFYSTGNNSLPVEIQDQGTPKPTTVTPATLASNSSANITVSVTGLVAAGESLRVERILDLNGNGVADPGEPLVQSFLVTDGQVTSFGGVRNPNIPADDNGASDGQITTHTSLPTSPELGRTAGSYVIRISSPIGKFTPVTKTLAVTQPNYGQSVSGQVTSGGSPVPFAVVSAVVPPGDDFVASVVSNSSGNFTLNLPAGSYALAAVQAGYVASMSAAFTLNASQTLTGRNLTLTPATCTISGKIRNLSDNSTLAGVQLNAKSATGDVAITASDATGNYVLRVLPGQWTISASDASMNALGFLRPNNDPTATATAGNTTTLDLPFTPATSMVYGTVKTPAGVPMPGVLVESGDDPNNSGDRLYSSNVTTDADGKYFLGMAGTTSWRVEVNEQAALSPYIMPDNQWIDPTPNAAILLNFAANQVTAHLQGTVTRNGSPASGLSITASASSNDIGVSATTDASGYFDLGVMAGTWDLGIDSDWATANQVIWPDFSKTISANQTIPGIAYELKDATATITGNVTDAFGNPFTGNNVYGSAWINNQNYNTRPYPDSNGNYSLPVLSGYDWTVGIDASGFNNEQIVSVPTSTPVNFVQSSIISDPDDQTVPLGQNATFSVTVNAPGTPSIQWQRLPNGADWDTGWIALANNSTYSGVPTANLTVHNTTSAMTGDQFRCVVSYTFNGTTPTTDTSDSAELLVVTAHLRGTVTKNGQPVSGMRIGAGGARWFGDNYTDANGNFDIGVTGDGNWYISLPSDSAALHNIVGPNLQVPVTNSQDVNGISILVADATSTISGRVVDANGIPVSDTGVYANASIGGNNYWGYSNTDSNGNFSFPVIDGTWNVGVNGPLLFTQQTVAVSGPAVVNFAPAAIVGHLQGTVTKNGTAAPGILVSAWQDSGGGTSVTTDANGNFDFSLTATGTWNIGLENNFALSHNLIGSRLTKTVSNNQTISGIALPIADATGTISGSVKDSGGNALAQAGMWANATINGVFFYGDAHTDANGNYSLPVINGTWTVGVGTAINFAQQTAAVTGSSVVNFAQRAVVAHLTGIVTNNGVAASGVTVFAGLQGGNDEWTTATSGNDGSFDLGVTSNGTWDVSLEQNYANSYNLVGEILSETVSGNQSIANIASHIADGTGTISGTVKDPNGNVLANISVYANATINGINFNANTQTDANGNYSFPVINGTWTVGVGNAPNFAQQTVAVTGSAQVNLNQLAVVAHLQGTVTKNGVAAPGILVNAWQDSMSISVTTDANGYFDFGLAATGTWNIGLENNFGLSHNLVGARLTKSVANNQTISGIALPIADATGTISGNVKDSGGNALAQAGIWANATVNGFLFFADAQTDNSGNYSLPVINGTWTAGVGTAANFPQQVVAVVGSGQANFTQLPVIAHLTGRVTKNGAGVAGIPVGAGHELSGVGATTDANGYFDLGVTSNGTWSVGVGITYAVSHNLFSPGLQVAVTNGQNVFNIALQIADSTGTISGNVKDSGGNPLTGTGVYANATINGTNYFVHVITDSIGNYSYPVIDGTWTLGVNSSLYFTLQTVTVTGSTQVNFAPVPVVAHLQGRVTKNGVALPGVTLGTSLQGPGNNDIGNTRIETITDSNGNFDLGVPGNGSWSVSLASDYASSHNLVGLSLIENVINNQSISNIACKVVDGIGTISGIVTDSGGNPLANMGVFAPANINGVNYFAQAQTDSNGNYSFPVINGTWAVRVLDTNFSQQVVTVNGSAQVNFTLAPIVAHLQGRMTKNGAGVSGTLIDAWPQDGSSPAVWATTDANGYFDIGVTGVGTWLIGLDMEVANFNNLVGTNQQRTITNNQTITSIPIQLTDGTGSIYGTVRDSGNNPVTETSIGGTATVNGVTYSAHARTDTNGNYSFPVINGTWTVSVTNPISFNPKTVTVNASAQVDFTTP